MRIGIVLIKRSDKGTRMTTSDDMRTIILDDTSPDSREFDERIFFLTHSQAERLRDKLNEYYES